MIKSIGRYASIRCHWLHLHLPLYIYDVWHRSSYNIISCLTLIYHLFAWFPQVDVICDLFELIGRSDIDHRYEC